MSEPNPNSIHFDEYIHFLLLNDEKAFKSLKEESFSGTGPGGQHRNRVRTGIRLIHPQWNISGECSQYREGKRNRSEALNNIRLNLDKQLEYPFKYFVGHWIKLPKQRINIQNRKYPLWRAAVKALWREDDFQTQGLKNQDYWSPTSLIKQCARDADLWQWINLMRKQRDLKCLKV